VLFGPSVLAGVHTCADASTYYANIVTSGPAQLRSDLHALIRGHQRILYTASASLDTWAVLEISDEDPADSARIVDVYRNTSFPKGTSGARLYQREHSWPSSYGFPNDGSSNYPFTDVHHLHLSDPSYNASRGNLPFGGCSSSCAERPTDLTNGVGGGTGVYPGNSNWRGAGFWEVWWHRRGDIARGLLYMDLRYEGGFHPITGAAEPDLILTDNPALIVTSGGQNAEVAHMGLLSVLLAWHEADPPDVRDQDRNEAACAAQGNRNPFTDRPGWAACVFLAECRGDAVFSDGFEDS
jgi:endonuclease I